MPIGIEPVLQLRQLSSHDFLVLLRSLDNFGFQKIHLMLDLAMHSVSRLPQGSVHCRRFPTNGSQITFEIARSGRQRLLQGLRDLLGREGIPLRRKSTPHFLNRKRESLQR